MEKYILKIFTCTHKNMLKPFPDYFKLLHLELYMANELIELFEGQYWPPLFRRSLRFGYCEVLTNILCLYILHLANSSFREESFDLCINPLPGCLAVPKGFVNSLENVTLALLGASPLIIVHIVSYPASQLN